MTATTIFPLEVWPAQITQASVPANENALRMQVALGAAKAITNIPPGSPIEDDIYVLDAAPTGVWSTMTPGNVVIYKGGAWLEFASFTGWIKSVGVDALMYDSGTWGSIGGGGGGGDGWTNVILSTTWTTTLATLSDITAFSFAADANSTYEIELFGAHQTSSASSAIGLAFTAPAGSDIIGHTASYQSATVIYGIYQYDTSTPNAGLGAIKLANQNCPIFLQYIIKTAGTTGTIMMQGRSKAATATSRLMQGITRFRWKKIA